MLIEYTMLKNIHLSEFLGQAWNKSACQRCTFVTQCALTYDTSEEKEARAPNILKYIAWFNKVSHWVTTEIMKRETAEERAVVIGKFIEMAMVCCMLS